jgi:hypothetical protein
MQSNTYIYVVNNIRVNYIGKYMDYLVVIYLWESKNILNK